MFFRKLCSRCKGTGVKDLESFSLGLTFFSFFIDLALPLLFLIGLGLLAYLNFGMTIIESPKHLATVMITGISLCIVFIWFVPKFLKKVFFNQCPICGGTGKQK